MVLVKILKRKDAASLIVAIVVAGIVGQFLAFTFFELSGRITDVFGGSSYQGSGQGWQQNYLSPAVTLVIQLVVLEILARIVVALRGWAVSMRAARN